MPEIRSLYIHPSELRQRDLILASEVHVAYAPRFDAESGVWMVPTINDAQHRWTVEVKHDEKVLVARSCTSDAEHEAAARTLLEGRDPDDYGRVTNGEALGALLRLLDEAREALASIPADIREACGVAPVDRTPPIIVRACPYCHGYACPAGGCLNGEVRS